MKIGSKICSTCKSNKDLSEFEFRKDRNVFRAQCKNCVANKRKEYYLKNKNHILNYQKSYKKKHRKISKKKIQTSQERKNKKALYYKLNRDNIRIKQKQYADDHKKEKSVYDKNYRLKNIDKIRINCRLRDKKNRLENPCYKIRCLVSRSIRGAIKKYGGKKQGKSTFNYLPYSIEELKKHLESKFESWMNWDNWGIYDVNTWDDNDSTTWTWQIDHIIPHSNFVYTSMSDENFIKCWSLDNLRPLSSKQNVQDQDRKGKM